MATKAEQLKKRLIRDAIIGAVLTIFLAGGAYEVSDYDDQTQSDKQRADGENSRLKGENDAMLTLLNSGAEVSAFYDAYIKEHKSGLMLDRELITKVLAELREKNHLVNLSITVSPIIPVADKALALKSGIMVQSEVKLGFSALTDNSVYGLIEAMQRELPGILVIHDVKITKTRDLTPDVLRGLNAHRIDPMITADITFTWLGVRPNEEKSNPATDALHPPAMIPRATP